MKSLAIHLRARRSIQRRFSFVLATALCMWLLAMASHFHVTDYEDGDHKSTHTLCAFCMSVPHAGVAPAVSTFISPRHLETLVASNDVAPTTLAPASTRYYSRGPPLR